MTPTAREQRAARILYDGARIAALILAFVTLATWGWVALVVMALATFLGSVVIIAEKYLP